MMQIFTHTPIWVWVLLAGLCVLGWSQTKTRQVSLQRVLILPSVMLLLSAHSMYKGFGSQTLCLVVWSLVAALTCRLVMRNRKTSAHRYDPVTQQFTLAGSWLPMSLILALFIGKYALNVSLAVHPAFAQQIPFALGFSILFGILNGLFLARPLTLWQLKSRSTYSTAEMPV